jgi:hypothetical protein
MTTTPLGGTVGRTPHGRSPQASDRPARYGLGSSTEATRAVGRDDDVVAEEEP